MKCSRRRLDWNFDECIFFQVVLLHHIEKKVFVVLFGKLHIMTKYLIKLPYFKKEVITKAEKSSRLKSLIPHLLQPFYNLKKAASSFEKHYIKKKEKNWLYKCK